MEFGGNALKTGRVTGALVQCPKLCQYISQIAENESQALSGRDSFQQIVEEKPPDNVQFQQLFQNSGYTAVTIFKTVTKRDGNAMIQYFSNGEW